MCKKSICPPVISHSRLTCVGIPSGRVESASTMVVVLSFPLMMFRGKFAHRGSQSWRSCIYRPYLKKDIYHLERIQRAATRWVKGLKTLVMKKGSENQNCNPSKKRRIRNDLVLTHTIMFHQIDLEASKLFKFSRRPGLRRPSIRPIKQTGRTRRRRHSFAYRVVKYWNRLPLAEASVQDHVAFKRQLENYIYP